MKVFGFPLSPYVRKVHLVAAEKGIAVEAISVNPRAPSPEFVAASPFKKIPALQDGDFTLADSTAIAVYFDAVQPSPPLLPGDAQAKGRAMWFDEYADTILSTAGGKVIFNRFVSPKVLGMPGDEAAAALGEIEIAPILDYLESVAPESGWLAGGEFSLGDIAVASTLKTLSYAMTSPDAAKHPRTAAWYDRVCARPAWQSVAAAEAKVLGAFA